MEKIEVIRRAKVRRAKLYHIRKKAAKEISREMRRVQNVRNDKTVTVAPASEAAPSAEEQPVNV